MYTELDPHRLAWKSYACTAAMATFSNTTLMYITAMITTSLMGVDYCEHHRGSWIFVCLSSGVTGGIAFQRYKHCCGRDPSDHNYINTASLMVNTAISVTCLVLAIQAESCK